ncbi:hypothetical protein CYMTET_30846 [Cymbomonas tetramitiformis]|uniref:HMG box domain-containing protein n=1 Tax=Cymbomonas tetramitiformis TaxID=36881 RepID=A0AAE0FI05_9CHLO|nr:hypothetical protein CYMTET_30846 [Cymbomonas tetramitiformis]
MGRQTPYFLFCSEHRESVKAELQANSSENSNISVTGVASALGAKWKGLTDEEKTAYKEKCATLNEESQAEERSGDPELARSGKKMAAGQTPTHKSLPGKKTAYFLFTSEQRESTKEMLVSEAPEGTKITVGEVAKAIAGKWKALTDEERQGYKTRCDEINEKLKAAEVGDSVNNEEGVEKLTASSLDEGEDLILPLARVKRIARLDEDVRMIKPDALRLIAKSTELFLEAVVAEALKVTKRKKRKTVVHSDLEMAVLTDGRMNFVSDLITRCRPQKLAKENTGDVTSSQDKVKSKADCMVGTKSRAGKPSKKVKKTDEPEPTPARRITAFFAAPK